MPPEIWSREGAKKSTISGRNVLHPDAGDPCDQADAHIARAPAPHHLIDEGAGSCLGYLMHKSESGRAKICLPGAEVEARCIGVVRKGGRGWR